MITPTIDCAFLPPTPPQELLEFTLAHQSQLTADGDLFGYDEEDEGCLLDGGEEGAAAALGMPTDVQAGGMGGALPASA